MRIGIVGSRTRNTKEDYNIVEKAFLKARTNDYTIVSGGCPKGGDRFAEIIARRFRVTIKIYPADWSLGRHAGFLRNTDIAKHSDILIACVSESRTGGTEDTIKKFKKFHPRGNLIIV